MILIFQNDQYIVNFFLISKRNKNIFANINTHSFIILKNKIKKNDHKFREKKIIEFILSSNEIILQDIINKKLK